MGFYTVNRSWSQQTAQLGNVCNHRMGGRREFTFSFYWLDGDPPHVAILSHSGFIRASTCTFPASTLVYDMTKVAISGLAQEPGALYAHTTLSFSFHTLPFLYNMLDKAFLRERKKDCCVASCGHGLSRCGYWLMGHQRFTQWNYTTIHTIKDAIHHTKVIIVWRAAKFIMSDDTFLHIQSNEGYSDPVNRINKVIVIGGSQQCTKFHCPWYSPIEFLRWYKHFIIGML